MKMKSLRNSLGILTFLFCSITAAQEIESDSIVVVKQYAPSVHDAFKIKLSPKITDSISLGKKTVNYSIISVPVASTFTPAKGRATEVARERPPKIYDNYVTLGFGSYTSALAEFYSNIEVNRTDNFGIFLTHSSAQGGIPDVVYEDAFYNTELNLNYASRGRNSVWTADFGVEHDLYNWYGVPLEFYPSQPQFEPQHNFYSVYAGAEANFEDSFFDQGAVSYRFFTDDYSAAEHRLILKPVLEIPIAGEHFNTSFTLDYLNGSFPEAYGGGEALAYSFLNLGVESGLLILRDDLTLNLGAALAYSLDTEQSDGAVYVYPRITASYRFAGDYFIGYAGLEGELDQNSYYELSEENPFVSPTLDIRPTDSQYKLYAGAKGRWSNSVGYNVKASYLTQNDAPLYVLQQPIVTDQREAYGYGNSFGVAYDQLKTVSAFGEIHVDVNRNFSLRTNGTYYLYDTDVEEEAWNMPKYRINILGDFQLADAWFAGLNLFVVGDRKARDFEEAVFTQFQTKTVDLDAYADLNAHLSYRFNDRLSVFAKGHNLLGNSYEAWNNYPVLGLQLMAGATYKFDFGR